MGKTAIEWSEYSWNPVTGCTPVSDGCAHCYASRMAQRLRGRFGYPQDDPFAVTLHPERLEEPLHWKKPRMVFVCSMGDLFHPRVPWEFICRVFDTMCRARQHNYQVLTKRPGRMAYFAKYIWDSCNDDGPQWPSNVWAGTSVEDQKYAARLDVLARVTAPVPFVSLEPLLGPVDLREWLWPKAAGKKCFSSNWDTPTVLSWVILGGETGPGARPMHLDWARSVRDQCDAAGVPFFFKSWGEYLPTEQAEGYPACHLDKVVTSQLAGDGRAGDVGHWIKAGKKAAGALLDGVEERGMP